MNRLAGVERHSRSAYTPTCPAEAREHHGNARKLVADGQCPVLIKRRKRQAAILGTVNTVKALGEAWYAELAPHKSASWRVGMRNWLDKYIFPELGVARQPMYNRSRYLGPHQTCGNHTS